MTPSAAPSLEEKTYRRVLFLSALDGWSIVIVAGLSALVSLAFVSPTGIVVSLLALVTGTMELRGRARLVRRDASGMRLLVRAQLILLSVILVYCAKNLGSFDAETTMGNLTPDMAAALNEAGLTQADILPLVRLTFYATYTILAVVSLVFQGGLTLYYRSRTARVTAFLTPPAAPTNYSVL